jgi:hypothetical protein
MLEVLPLCVIVALAFFTEAAIGFGSTVITVTLGAHLVPLDRLLPAFVPLNLTLSSYLIARHHRHIAWGVFGRRLVPPMAAGTAVGLWIYRLGTPGGLLLPFALFVTALAAVELVRLRRAAAPARPLARPFEVGLLALGGVVHGLYGSGGPMVVYCASRLLPDRSAFRSTLSLLWLGLNLALAVQFFTLGQLGGHSLRLSGYLGASLLLGLALGEWAHGRLGERLFRLAMYVVLGVAGLSLALRTLLETLR